MKIKFQNNRIHWQCIVSGCQTQHITPLSQEGIYNDGNGVIGLSIVCPDCEEIYELSVNAGYHDATVEIMLSCSTPELSKQIKEFIRSDNVNIHNLEYFIVGLIYGQGLYSHVLYHGGFDYVDWKIVSGLFGVGGCDNPSCVDC